MFKLYNSTLEKNNGMNIFCTMLINFNSIFSPHFSPSDNEKGLAIERNRANGQSSKDKYGAPQQYPQRDTYGANQQYPQKDRYGANQPYPQKDRYGANEPYPQKDKYGAHQPYPQKDSYAANGNYGSVGR